MRSFLCLLLLTGLFAAGCSKTEPPTMGEKVSGSQTAAGPVRTQQVRPQRPQLTVISNTHSDAVSRGSSWKTLDYLCSDDEFTLVVRPVELAASPSLHALFRVFAGDSLSPAQMDWVCVSGKLAAMADPGVLHQVTIAFRSTVPTQSVDVASSRFPNAKSQIVRADGVEYIRLTGITREDLEFANGNAVRRISQVPALAVHQCDAYTIVVCPETRLSHVLDASQGRRLKTLVSEVDSDSPMLLAVANQAGSDELWKQQMHPDVAMLFSDAASFLAQVNPEHETVISLKVNAADAAAASRLTRNLTSQQKAVCRLLSDFGAIAPAELAPVVQAAHGLISSASITEESGSVHVSVLRSSGFEQFVESIVAIVSPVVAAR